jgi:tellurite resistance protein TehA-like permease
MATGIVSIAAFQQGLETLARGFLAVNVIAYVVLWALTIARLVRFPGRVRDDMAAHQRGAGFLTIVAGTNVLGSEVALLTSWTGLALALWVAGLVLWLLITYWFLTAVTVRPDKPPLEAGIGGAWLLLVVSTESIAALGALLAPSMEGPTGLLLVSVVAHLVGLMLYVVVIGLIFYRWTFFSLSGEQVTPPYWINMGALAITTLAGSNLVLAAGSWEVLDRLVPFLSGTTLLAWGFATWWIPLLLAIGVWRHGIERVPIRFDPQYWSLVFPLGMYAASTFRLDLALGVGLLSGIAATAFWVAVAAWLLTAAGLIGSVVRPDHA